MSLRRSAAYSLEIKPGDGQFVEGRVGVIFRAVRPGEFLGLDHQMDRLRRMEPSALRSKPSRMLSISQRGDALAVGRQLENVVAAVVARNRLDPIGVVLLEIGLAQVAAVGLHEGVDLVGDLALVEGVASALADEA